MRVETERWERNGDEWRDDNWATFASVAVCVLLIFLLLQSGSRLRRQSNSSELCCFKSTSLTVFPTFPFIRTYDVFLSVSPSFSV